MLLLNTLIIIGGLIITTSPNEDDRFLGWMVILCGVLSIVINAYIEGVI